MAHLIFNNKKIFYRVEGEGKPVLLLHGFGEDGNIWNPQIEALKKENSLIIPDLPGSGNSEMLEGNQSINDYAEVVKAIVDQEINKDEKKRFCLVGHSMGGYITLAFAEKYPGLLNSFGLFHSSAYADNPQKIETRKKAIEFIRKNGAKEFLKTSIPNLFAEKTKQERPELIERLLKIANKIPAEALIQYYEAMIARPDRTSVLRSFSKPILFIIGNHDTAVPMEDSVQQSHLPAVSSIHILQNSGHVGMWEETPLSSVYLCDFLRLTAK